MGKIFLIFAGKHLNLYYSIAGAKKQLNSCIFLFFVDAAKTEGKRHRFFCTNNKTGGQKALLSVSKNLF